MKRYYYRYRKHSKNPIEDLLDGLFTLFTLYLLLQYFVDRANFWRLVIYGVVISIIFFALVIFINRLKGTKKVYYPYQRYFRHRPTPTPEALKLGNLLRQCGWNVEFEKWDGYKHIDIAITEAKMNIEVEGSQHNLKARQALTYQKRDYYSEQKGFITKRIPNSIIRDDMKLKEEVELLNRQLAERVRDRYN